MTSTVLYDGQNSATNMDTMANSTARGKKAIIHVQKIDKNSPRALRSGKQYGDSAANEFYSQIESSQPLHILADIVNQTPKMAPFSTAKSQPAKYLASSTPKDTIPESVHFEVSDEELSLIPDTTPQIVNPSKKLEWVNNCKNTEGQGHRVAIEISGKQLVFNSDKPMPKSQFNEEANSMAQEEMSEGQSYSAKPIPATQLSDSEITFKSVIGPRLGSIPEELEEELFDAEDNICETDDAQIQTKEKEEDIRNEPTDDTLPAQDPAGKFNSEDGELLESDETKNVDGEEDPDQILSPKTSDDIKDPQESTVYEKVKIYPQAKSGQYADLVQEMCAAFMPTLENITTTLSAPGTGLVAKVGELETFGKKVYGMVYKTKTGLVARMDRMENAISNGPTSLNQKIKSFDPLVQKIEPIDNRLKDVESFIPDESLVSKVNVLEEKMQQLQTVTPEGTVTIPASNEDIRANKRKCDELTEKVDMASNYLDVLFKEVAVMKKQIITNTA